MEIKTYDAIVIGEHVMFHPILCKMLGDELAFYTVSANKEPNHPPSRKSRLDGCHN